MHIHTDSVLPSTHILVKEQLLLLDIYIYIFSYLYNHHFQIDIQSKFVRLGQVQSFLSLVCPVHVLPCFCSSCTEESGIRAQETPVQKEGETHVLWSQIFPKGWQKHQTRLDDFVFVMWEFNDMNMHWFVEKQWKHNFWLSSASINYWVAIQRHGKVKQMDTLSSFLNVE